MFKITSNPKDSAPPPCIMGIVQHISMNPDHDPQCPGLTTLITVILDQGVNLCQLVSFAPFCHCLASEAKLVISCSFRNQSWLIAMPWQSTAPSKHLGPQWTKSLSEMVSTQQGYLKRLIFNGPFRCSLGKIVETPFPLKVLAERQMNSQEWKGLNCL